mmetsp:Transcript_42876/g.130431  ORF Transcript_42876/g.130431 Transcript_42876/m.130431 type:complete len:210 (+) Transcript_42876:1027-1656(+)
MLFPHRPERGGVRPENIRPAHREGTQVRRHHGIAGGEIPAVLQQYRPDVPRRPSPRSVGDVRIAPVDAGGVPEGDGPRPSSQDGVHGGDEAPEEGGEGRSGQVPAQESGLLGRARLSRGEPCVEREESRDSEAGDGVQCRGRIRQRGAQRQGQGCGQFQERGKIAEEIWTHHIRHGHSHRPGFRHADQALQGPYRYLVPDQRRRECLLG